MAVKKAASKPAISPERLEEIRASARSGTNWASQVNYGATCVCGAGERTLIAAHALKGKHGNPTGECHAHPGGTVFASLPKEN